MDYEKIVEKIKKIQAQSNQIENEINSSKEHDDGISENVLKQSILEVIDTGRSGRICTFGVNDDELPNHFNTQKLPNLNQKNDEISHKDFSSSMGQLELRHLETKDYNEILILLNDSIVEFKKKLQQVFILVSNFSDNFNKDLIANIHTKCSEETFNKLLEKVYYSKEELKLLYQNAFDNFNNQLNYNSKFFNREENTLRICANCFNIFTKNNFYDKLENTIKELNETKDLYLTQERLLNQLLEKNKIMEKKLIKYKYNQ